MSPRCVLGALLIVTLLMLVGPVDTTRRRGMSRKGWRASEFPTTFTESGTRASTSSTAGAPSTRTAEGVDDALRLRGCDRVFIDGGSNTGESVRAFVKGHFYTCGLHSPNRQYRTSWPHMTRAQRQAAMQPLREPSSFCIRSFEAAPELVPVLRRQEAELRQQRYDVRFIDGALSNASSPAAPRTVVQYARNQWGASAVGLRFEDVHIGGKPTALSTRTVLGASYDVREVLTAALATNRSGIVALKLDVEGTEWWLLEALTADTALLCAVSYLFVEFHSTASAEQRAKLPSYGLREDLFEALKTRVHAAMESACTRRRPRTSHARTPLSHPVVVHASPLLHAQPAPYVTIG